MLCSLVAAVGRQGAAYAQYRAGSPNGYCRSYVTKLKKCSYITHADDNRFSWSDFPNLVFKDLNGNEESIPLKDRFAQYIRFIFAYVHLVKPVLKDLRIE